MDARIADLADANEGIVDRRQLLELGLLESAIDRRLAAGRLHRLHRGVYAVGDRSLPPLGRLVAAVRATGGDAVASHRSAASLHELRPYEGRPQATARPGTKKQRGIRVIQSELRPDEVTVVRGIRVTTVARTLIDLGAVDAGLVEKALRQAEYLGLFDLQEVSPLLERYPRRRGTARLRAAIAAWVDSDVRTRSDMEDAFRALVLDASLPEPEMNGAVALDGLTIEADAVWREAKLIVELDGRQAHATRSAFETDRERDRLAALAGWLVIRVTWRQLNEQAGKIVHDVQRLLGARSRG